MKETNNRSGGILAAVWVAVFTLPVCVIGQQLTPQEGAAKMEAARLEIAVTRTNIVQTLEQLDLVRSSKDPKAQLQRFTGQLAKMEERARVTREYAQTMKNKGDAYFADWEAQIAGIQDPEARRQVEANYSKRKKSYDRIVEFMQKAGKDFAPMLDMLKEIQQLLEGETTQGKIAAAKDLFMRANWRCGDVQRSLMEVERQFENLAADFTVTTSIASPTGSDANNTNNTTRKESK